MTTKPKATKNDESAIDKAVQAEPDEALVIQTDEFERDLKGLRDRLVDLQAHRAPGLGHRQKAIDNLDATAKAYRLARLEADDARARGELNV